MKILCNATSVVTGRACDQEAVDGLEFCWTHERAAQWRGASAVRAGAGSVYSELTRDDVRRAAKKGRKR